MSDDPTSVAALRATLRSLLPVEALPRSSDLDRAVACCFCDGSASAAADSGCDAARSECPKVGRCGHSRRGGSADGP